MPNLRSQNSKLSTFYLRRNENLLDSSLPKTICPLCCRRDHASFLRRIPLNVAENAVGKFGVLIGIIPTQYTKLASRLCDLAVSGSVHNHVIGRCGAATLINQLDNLRLIKNEFAAHHNFFCFAYSVLFLLSRFDC